MRIYNWMEIQRYHDAGHPFVECAKHFGFTHTAWAKAIKRGELIARFRKDGERPIDLKDRRRIYDWSAIQRYYDEGHTYKECKAHFGFATDSWTQAVRRGALRARGNQLPLAVLLIRSDRSTIKRRLLDAGILKNVCDECALTEWRGRALQMHIDHINGVSNDNRLENLRMLCPNCHSQTPTYGGRNLPLLRRLQEQPRVM